jgi:hypothetical protein
MGQHHHQDWNSFPKILMPADQGSSINQLWPPFGCADKPAEKHCWLICCERKTPFRLKK